MQLYKHSSSTFVHHVFNWKLGFAIVAHELRMMQLQLVVVTSEQLL
jgi:hypothetical protein